MARPFHVSLWGSLTVLVVLLMVGRTAWAATDAGSVTREASPVAPAEALETATTAFPADAPSPMPIGVAIFVDAVSRLAESAGTFDAQVDVQTRWRDSRLAFDMKQVGADRLEFAGDDAQGRLARMWTPKLRLANLIHAADRPPHVDPGLTIFADGSVVYIQRIKGTFEVKYKLAAFPFDVQRLPIRLESTVYGTDRIALNQDQRDADQSGLADDLAIGGWRPKGLDVTTGRIRNWNGGFVPDFQGLIAVQRQPAAHLAAIFTPFGLILLIPTVYTLFAKTDLAPRLTALSGAILAMIALSFSLTARYPALDSNGLVSQLLSVGFGYEVLMILVAITVLNPPVAERLGNAFGIAETVRFLRWACPLGLIVLIASRCVLTALTW